MLTNSEYELLEVLMAQFIKWYLFHLHIYFIFSCIAS